MYFLHFQSSFRLPHDYFMNTNYRIYKEKLNNRLLYDIYNKPSQCMGICHILNCFVIIYKYFPLVQGYRIEDIYILFIIFLFLLRKKIFDCLWISVADCSDLSPFCSDWQQKGECTKNPAYMDDNCKKACGKCSKSNHIFISCNQFICVRWLGYMEYCFHIEMYL